MYKSAVPKWMKMFGELSSAGKKRLAQELGVAEHQLGEIVGGSVGRKGVDAATRGGRSALEAESNISNLKNIRDKLWEYGIPEAQQAGFEKRLEGLISGKIKNPNEVVFPRSAGGDFTKSVNLRLPEKVPNTAETQAAMSEELSSMLGVPKETIEGVFRSRPDMTHNFIQKQQPLAFVPTGRSSAADIYKTLEHERGEGAIRTAFGRNAPAELSGIFANHAGTSPLIREHFADQALRSVGHKPEMLRSTMRNTTFEPDVSPLFRQFGITPHKSIQVASPRIERKLGPRVAKEYTQADNLKNLHDEVAAAGILDTPLNAGFQDAFGLQGPKAYAEAMSKMKRYSTKDRGQLNRELFLKEKTSELRTHYFIKTIRPYFGI